MATRRIPNESYWSAMAAECANEQGRFWEYHDKLYDEWRGEYVGTYTKPNLKKFAADLKLDTDKFATCIDTDRTRQVIEQDIAEANRLGINSTPSFFVNGRKLEIRSLDVGEFTRTFDLFLK